MKNCLSTTALLLLFGLGEGKEWGFKMNVDLRIQVEAIAQP